ncbi:MAG: MBL fold metallo-hydrolase [Planctomycetes bacterium]|nr:MBL fold metallo-hydrolase [Planctomycetota bacterium]
MRSKLFLLPAGIAVCLTTAAVLGAPNEVKVSELAPGVFFRKAQLEPKFTGCNQGWVVFRDYVLVIDANFPGQAEEVIKVIRQHTDKPIRFVFDTHYHGDHADGNQQYEQIGATVVAQERSQPLFQTKGAEGFARSKQEAGTKDEYGALKYAMPSLYFSHKLVFDDGEQRVELLFLGHAHTAGDAVAWLPRHRILFTGDACVNGAFNYTGDSNTESWISVLGAMEDLDPRHVAPGHGELAGKELLAMQKRYFVELRQSIRAATEAGKTLDQVKQSHDLPFYKEWTGVEARTRVENIEHVFSELTKNKKSLGESKRFRRWQSLPVGDGYAAVAAWERLGQIDEDARWSSLAGLYLRCDSVMRKQLREYFSDRADDLRQMPLYVCRVAAQLRTADDVDGLRRALAIAAIEGGRSDSAQGAAAQISLTLLRHGAARAGIDSDALFRQIQEPEFLTPESQLLFENVRTMETAKTIAVVRDSGPAEWVAEFRPRTGQE